MYKTISLQSLCQSEGIHFAKCMSRLSSFVIALSSCEARQESENYMFFFIHLFRISHIHHTTDVYQLNMIICMYQYIIIFLQIDSNILNGFLVV